jgi:hypothetical protein
MSTFISILFGLISGHAIVLLFIRKHYYFAILNIVLFLLFLAYQIIKG